MNTHTHTHTHTHTNTHTHTHTHTDAGSKTTLKDDVIVGRLIFYHSRTEGHHYWRNADKKD